MAQTIELSPEALKQIGNAVRLMVPQPAITGPVSCKWPHSRRQIADMPRFRLHGLRHTYAIGELRNGRDIYDLSHHLGHSSVKVTEIYLEYAANSRAKGRRWSNIHLKRTGGSVKMNEIARHNIARVFFI